MYMLNTVHLENMNHSFIHLLERLGRTSGIQYRSTYRYMFD